jgi:excisionase family DNA binding protein
LAVKEAACRLNVSTNRIAAGELPAYRLGRAVRISAAAIQSFLMARR